MATDPNASKPLVVYFGTSNKGVGIEVYEMNQESGQLSKRGETRIPGRGWIDLDPSERYLYAAVDGDAVASFAVDKESGALKLVASGGRSNRALRGWGELLRRRGLGSEHQSGR